MSLYRNQPNRRLTVSLLSTLCLLCPDSLSNAIWKFWEIKSWVKLRLMLEATISTERFDCWVFFHPSVTVTTHPLQGCSGCLMPTLSNQIPNIWPAVSNPNHLDLPEVFQVKWGAFWETPDFKKRGTVLFRRRIFIFTVLMMQEY